MSATSSSKRAALKPGASGPVCVSKTPAHQAQISELRVMQIADILRDPAMQIRAEINQVTVEEYSEGFKAGDQFPPIIVYFDGTNYILTDGFHRVEGAVRAGLQEINAEIRSGTRQHALVAALGANIHHGLRRTNADKRKAAEIAAKAFPDLSDRVIADMCGVGNQLVGDVRKQLCDSHSSKDRLGRDGKRREVPSKSGRKEEDEHKVPIKSTEVRSETPTNQTSENKTAESVGADSPPLPATVKDQKADDEEHVFHLADGTNLPHEALGEGWIDVDWITIKLPIILNIFKPLTPIEKQLCAQHQRMVIALSHALNLEVGNIPSPDALDNVVEALNDINNYTVTRNSYRRSRPA